MGRITARAYLCTWKIMWEGCGKDYSKGLSMYVENDVGSLWEGLQQGHGK